ncbi:hypothetical protein AVEN_151527-1 [Araneus ventricosus]|uniref:Uncharacterized protein n=1 Tax=Araneus ventricosus TaxID=182803 RepID=A0A4Y2IDQ2_ARAVE|nr:hypothetical protein AVEN_151527-1 [Araneus ventricosus]
MWASNHNVRSVSNFGYNRSKSRRAKCILCFLQSNAKYKTRNIMSRYAKVGMGRDTRACIVILFRVSDSEDYETLSTRGCPGLAHGLPFAYGWMTPFLETSRLRRPACSPGI